MAEIMVAKRFKDAERPETYHIGGILGLVE
jgi:hypothetical protein